MEELNVFDKLTAIATPAQLTMFGDSGRSRAIAEHKAWLQSIRHERPNTEANYKIGIYIRYFNQTKYEDYLSLAKALGIKPVDNKKQEETENKEKKEPTPLNDTNPLWMKAPNECTDEEYVEFYQKVFLDFKQFLFHTKLI